MKKFGHGLVAQTLISNFTNQDCNTQSEIGTCMKGSIFPQKDRNRWAVNWYCSLNKRSYTITRYRNHFMPITCYQRNDRGDILLDNKGNMIPDKERCHGYHTAQKLLASIQARWEQHCQGICQFNIDEFTGKKWTRN